MADFVKSVDPNHLVMVGTWGYFGQSSPELLAENPYDLSWRTVNGSNNAGIWSAGDHQLFPLELVCSVKALPNHACTRGTEWVMLKIIERR